LVLPHSVTVALWSLTIPVALTGVASVLDLRSRQISNWIPLTLLAWATFATAVAWSGIGWQGFAIGLAIGLAVGLLLFASGGFGGGDAKLVAVLGAALGWKGFLICAVLMGLVGGALGIVAGLRGRRDYAYAPAIAGGVAGYALLCVWKILLVSHPGVVR
jgi:Flp pilus assembly protein protease CpaA